MKILSASTFMWSAFLFSSFANAANIGIHENISAKVLYDSSGFKCIDRIYGIPRYQIITNTFGAKKYTCAIEFSALDINGRAVHGERILAYGIAPITNHRADLRDQRSYIEERSHTQEVYYLDIPNSIYEALNGVSNAAEEAEIGAIHRLLLKDVKNFNEALRNACFLAVLETTESFCNLEAKKEVQEGLINNN